MSRTPLRSNFTNSFISIAENSLEYLIKLLPLTFKEFGESSVAREHRLH